MDLVDNEYKTTVINMLKELKKIMDKEIKERIYEQNENVNNEIEAIKKELNKSGAEKYSI